MLAIIQAAGWPIWLLLIASIIGLTLIIERSIYSASQPDLAAQAAARSDPGVSQR